MGKTDNYSYVVLPSSEHVEQLFNCLDLIIYAFNAV